MPDLSRSLHLPDEAATTEFAARLAPHLRPGMQIWLRGGLGAGKTTLVRGLLAALGHAGRVRSPTFTLHEPYAIAGLTLHHFDLYRFSDPREWWEAGFDELVAPPSISLIEWPEQAAGALAPPDLDLLLEPIDEARQLTLSSHSPKGDACLRAAMP
jgi:tRNA threonylcarbamoyladenosine biosynthesis protein TsaE